MINIYFTDVFGVNKKVFEDYGAFNISLINDLPLFIDPFLLFNSDNPEYQALHSEIINYVQFLRDKSKIGKINKGALESWFYFPEIKQTWFGYSKQGNTGSGLGPDFAKSLNKNLHTIFSDFGNETITKGIHLEKLCLIKDGIGKDKISDFTTNLILEFILKYTEDFSGKHIDKKFIKKTMINKVNFNYMTETWVPKSFNLPYFNGDYVLICPKDILTKDDNWISHKELVEDFSGIVSALSSTALRNNINNYIQKILPASPQTGDYPKAVTKAIIKYPQVIDHYISLKENNAKEASSVSRLKISDTENRYIKQIGFLVQSLFDNSKFYEYDSGLESQIKNRISQLKLVIENNDGWEFFYVKGNPVTREADLKLLLLITWCTPASGSTINKNSYKIVKDSVDFKLASNPVLKQNLQKLKDDEKNGEPSAIRVIFYFTDDLYDRVREILINLKLTSNKKIILIDATGS